MGEIVAGSCVREEKVDFWHTKGKNIILIGPVGVGKTQLVLECMARNGLSLDTNVAQWSTPLLDFVGPKAEDADVLYFDSLGDDTSQQAVKEILSLRRWRGKALKPTAVVWASFTSAWNETAEEYNDAPQDVRDVFDVVVAVRTRPLHSYFEKRFGQRVSEAAIQWWDDLSSEDKRLVSPRRLEMALKMWEVKGDMRDVLPVSSCVAKLMQAINVSPIKEKLLDLLKHDEATRRSFLTNENNLNMSIKAIIAEELMMIAFLPCISMEKLAIFMAAHDTEISDKVTNHVLRNYETVPVFSEAVRRVLFDNQNARLIKKIRRHLLTVSETPKK